jgi:hypothetical protein
MYLVIKIEDIADKSNPLYSFVFVSPLLVVFRILMQDSGKSIDYLHGSDLIRTSQTEIIKFHHDGTL